MGDSASSREERFSNQVKAIIEKYEQELLPREPKRERFTPEAYAELLEEYKRESEKYQRELWLMRFHLLEERSSIEYDNGEELKEMIANKMAMSLSEQSPFL